MVRPRPELDLKYEYPYKEALARSCRFHSVDRLLLYLVTSCTLIDFCRRVNGGHDASLAPRGGRVLLDAMSAMAWADLHQGDAS